MSRTSHELAILTQLEALADNLEANNQATQVGFTESVWFSQEDASSNVILYLEAHPNLRGEILSISLTNIRTDLSAGMTVQVGDADPNAYLEPLILVAEDNNISNTVDLDGVANLFPTLGVAAGVRGAEYVITASDLIEVLFTSSADTMIGDVTITIRWFE